MSKAASTELKLTFVVLVYALFKVLEDLGVLSFLLERKSFGISWLTLFNDGLFYVGHSYLYNCYHYNSESLLKSDRLDTHEKLNLRYNMKTAMYWALARVCAMVCLRNYFDHVPAMLATLVANILAFREVGIC